MFQKSIRLYPSVTVSHSLVHSDPLIGDAIAQRMKERIVGATDGFSQLIVERRLIQADFGQLPRDQD